MINAVLPALRAALERAGTKLNIQIVTAPTQRIYDLLIAEQIDAGVAITIDPEKVPAGLVWQSFSTLDLVLIVSQGHPLSADVVEPTSARADR